MRALLALLALVCISFAIIVAVAFLAGLVVWIAAIGWEAAPRP